MTKMLLLVTMVTLVIGQGGADPDGHERQKRYLDWSTYTLISSDTNYPDMLITQYKPHSDVVNENENYLAFTLYSGNTGTFHFVNAKESYDNMVLCDRWVPHTGAYYTIYGRCPENDSDLVASGFCWLSGGLSFNSYTFNSKGYAYMNNAYYANEDRTVHPDEQIYLTNCYNSWRDAKFPVTDWSCPISGKTPLGPADGGVALKEECCDCGAGSIWLSMYLMAITTVLNSLLVRS